MNADPVDSDSDGPVASDPSLRDFWPADADLPA